MKFFLIGYMGSGKSTIGPLLAQNIARPFLDFDDYIEKREGRLISEIFEERGEIYFRKLEIDYLKDLLNDDSMNGVIALGGGTPCYGDSLQRLKEAPGKLIYLNWPYKKLAQNLWDAREKRPLIAKMKTYLDLEDFIRKHLFERGYYYNQSDIIIKIENQTSEEIVEIIKLQLF